MSPKCLGHLLSLWAHKVPPTQTWRMERHLHHPQSQSSATLHTKTREPASPNTICYRGGQHLLDCWSIITENSKQSPFIVWLASASWQSWQPTACSLLMKTQGCSGSATSVSPSTCSGITACFGFAFFLTWQSKIECQDAAFMFMKLQAGFIGDEAATLLEDTSHLNKVGHLQERNPLVFHVILLLEFNNLTLRF